MKVLQRPLLDDIPTTSEREAFMVAARDSLATACPERLVLRGMVDPTTLPDDALRKGVLTLIATGRDSWLMHTGREGEYGRLEFVIVGYVRLKGSDESTERLERTEAQLEHEVLQWVRDELKPAPLDAVYPLRCSYSGGLETPIGWFVMELEGHYV
jgi:hypothetical protein